MDTAAVVLAAGEGTRLKSKLPKVLHEVAGRPLLAHVLAALAPIGVASTTLVVSPRRDEIAAVMEERGFDRLTYAIQDPPRGTGDAARVGLDTLPPGVDRVLILPGDTPLLEPSTIWSLLDAQGDAAAAMLTARLADPTGYGRVVRDPAGHVERIVEQRDTTSDQAAIDEVNAGIYVFDVAALRNVISDLGSDNDQGELYLTDAIGLLVDKGMEVVGLVGPASELAGVNTRGQLAEAGRTLRIRTCVRWMEEGVTIVDPTTTYIDPGVTVAPDATILPFTFLEGDTIVEAGATVGPQTRIIDSTISEGATVTFAVVVGSDIGPHASVGPYASLRSGTVLERGAKLGTFVESKNSRVGPDSKAGHLSYLGDATLGRGVNVGAGTITCNWDGVSKHETVIEDDVYVGSDTMLVAPLHVGKGAATGAGSVVTRDVPDGSLAVGVPARMIGGRGNRMKDHKKDEGEGSDSSD